MVSDIRPITMEDNDNSPAKSASLEMNDNKHCTEICTAQQVGGCGSRRVACL